MSASLRELARLVDGRLSGNGDIIITGAATIRTASPGDITLADDSKLASKIASCPASAVVVSFDFQPAGIPYIAVRDVHAAFARIVSHFRPPCTRQSIGISPAAHISPSAKIGANVDVYPGATVGPDVEIGPDSAIHAGAQIMAGCRLGQRVILFPNVVLYHNTVVGDRSIIHAGAVIGAYGFGYQTVNGRHQLSAQLGNVEIGADVEIGACTTIDRGTYGSTVIGEGTKIDNQVMIAHNCRIGRHNLICSQAGIAGSCTTGDYVVMAGQVGLRDHVDIGEQARIGAKAGVMHDIPAGGTYVGIPATPEREQMHKQAALSKLPEMRRQLKALQRTVDELLRSAESSPEHPVA
jgi:UDP-3-O-[3-hydroxymyristoyl] glucosamine N-acyltransferase